MLGIAGPTRPVHRPSRPCPRDLGAVDGHDRYHHVGVGQDQGGLVGLEQDGLQARGEGVSAMPQPPGQVELEAAAILLGVDHEHPAGADRQMVDVGLAMRDGQVVQDRPPLPLQRVEEPGGAPLPRCPASPGDGIRAGLEPQPQPAARAASPPRTSPSRGASRLPRIPPPAPIPRMAAIRQGRVRIQTVHSAARSCHHLAWAEPPGRPTLARTRTATTGRSAPVPASSWSGSLVRWARMAWRSASARLRARPSAKVVLTSDRWREDQRPAEPLHRPGSQQELGCRREAASERGASIKRQARHEDPASSEQIGSATTQQQEAAGHHRVGADHRLQDLRGVAQLATNLGQRDHHDVLIERDDQHRERQQRQRGRLAVATEPVLRGCFGACHAKDS
jgi:hypothetical protein